MTIDSSIRGIIFDLDGVIADSHPVHEMAWRALLAESGKPVSDSGLLFIRQGRTRIDILRYFFPECSLAEWTALGAQKHQLYEHNIGYLKPFPGVLEWIRSLAQQSIPLALATCASRDRALNTLSRFDVAECFQTVVTGSDVLQGKPDPALFLRAASELQIRSQEALVIEDSLSGVMAAKAAGMRCAVFSPGLCDEKILALAPDYIFSSFEKQSICPPPTILFDATITRKEDAYV